MTDTRKDRIAGQLALIERGLFDPFVDDVAAVEPEEDYWAYGARGKGNSFLGSLKRDDARATTRAETAMRDAARVGQPRLLVCRGLDVSYGQVQVLFRVDFDLAPGEIVALLGTNGAGKSTLLRALSGLTPVSGGAILLDGLNITNTRPDERARLGMTQTPGGKGIFPGLSVAEHIRIARESATELDTSIDVLELFPALASRVAEPAGNLSGGEQQMLTVGMAFLSRPKLLLIDELSLGLAPAIVEQLLDVVRAVNARGTTIVIVEQSVNVALTVAERAVFMEKGEVRFTGPTAELMGRPDIMRAVFLQGARGSSRSVNVDQRATNRARGATATAERPVVLEAKDLEVRFGGIRAVAGVSLAVREAEILGFIGPNGAGKTTLFDLLSGFLAPDAGKVFLDAVDVSDLGPDERANVGLGRTFQDASLFASLTVAENIAVALERHLEARSVPLGALQVPSVRRAERSMRKKVDRIIDLFGLGDYSAKFVGELSTGTRRIVALACLTAMGPRVLLLDEPSSGLAQRETEEMGPLLRQVNKDTGAAMLVIEHDIPLITGLADELIALELGRVITRGTPDDVINHPAVIASYMGDSPSLIHRSGSH